MGPSTISTIVVTWLFFKALCVDVLNMKQEWWLRNLKQVKLEQGAASWL